MTPRTSHERMTAESLAAHLEQRIRNGEWQVGDKMPTELNLAKQFHISVHMASRVMHRLRQKGLVERKQGSGTYVRDTRKVRRVSVRRYLDAARGAGGLPDDQLVDDESPPVRPKRDLIPAASEIAERLGLVQGEKVLQRTFTVRDGDRAVETTQSWIPHRLIASAQQGLGPLFSEPWPGGISDQLRKAIDMHVTQIRELTRNRPATNSEADRLGIPEDSLVLEVSRQTFHGSEIVETADQVYPLLDVELEYFTDFSTPGEGNRDEPTAREAGGGDVDQG